MSSDSYGAPISSSGADALALSEWEFLARDDEDDEFRLCVAAAGRPRSL